MSKPNHILSCFIDESGDFGPYEAHSPYYYVTFVLHDQNSDLTNMINGLNQRMSNEGIANHAIHTGPLIRRENHYEFESLTEYEVNNQMSHSELVFFGGHQKFKKDYYRKLTAKRM